MMSPPHRHTHTQKKPMKIVGTIYFCTSGFNVIAVLTCRQPCTYSGSCILIVHNRVGRSVALIAWSFFFLKFMNVLYIVCHSRWLSRESCSCYVRIFLFFSPAIPIFLKEYILLWICGYVIDWDGRIIYSNYCTLITMLRLKSYFTVRIPSENWRARW